MTAPTVRTIPWTDAETTYDFALAMMQEGQPAANVAQLLRVSQLVYPVTPADVAAIRPARAA